MSLARIGVGLGMVVGGSVVALTGVETAWCAAWMGCGAILVELLFSKEPNT